MSVPTPSEIAHGRYTQGKSQRNFRNSFYNSPVTGVSYSQLNQGSWPPSVNEIGNYQIQQIKQNMPIDPQLQKIANNLTKDIVIPFVEENVPIEEALQKIEQALQYQEEGSAARLSQTIDKETITNLMIKYENLKIKLSQVYSLISSASNQISGHILKNNLNRIQEMIQQLEAELNAISTSGNNYSPSIEMVGYLKKADWLGRRLKGQYLEVVGTNWVSQHIPNNIKVVNVGRITGPTIDILGGVSGYGKQLRTDIIGFDITKNVQISFKLNSQDKTLSLIDFLDLVEKADNNTQINLGDDGYAQLREALVIGIQAKAGKNQAIFNPKPVSLEQAIQTEGAGSQYANNLILLNKLVTLDNVKWIAKTHKYYDAMFNYCLAKGLTNIIGRENNLVLTRNGIQLMRDYLIEQWEKGQKYVQARTRVHIDDLGHVVDVVYSAKQEK